MDSEAHSNRGAGDSCPGAPPTAWIVTCEHGGNKIPDRYRSFFAGHEALLAGHRGWDPGALPLARYLARHLRAPLHFSRISRLLVDLNRSTHHPRVFSSIVRSLPRNEREDILDRWYRPYRGKVTGAVRASVGSGHVVVHVAVHTFTAVLDGKTREVEVGLLFDPARASEKTFCHALGRQLRRRLLEGKQPVRVRLNQPYQGRSDGLATALRRGFPAHAYLGIELEVNQALILGSTSAWPRTRRILLESLRAAVVDGGLFLPGS